MTVHLTAGVQTVDSDTVGQLLAADPTTGRVAALVRPRPRLEWIARDLQVALGAQYTGRVGEARDDRQWPMLAARLISDDITDVVLCGIHLVARSDLTRLIAEIRRTSGRWWLIGDGRLSEDHEALLAHLDVTITHDFTIPPPPRPDARPTGHPRPVRIRLARSDFPTFLADCQRLLSPTNAAHIIDRWHHHHEDVAARWPAQVTTAGVHERLVDIVAGTLDVTDAVVAIRPSRPWRSIATCSCPSARTASIQRSPTSVRPVSAMRSGGGSTPGCDRGRRLPVR